MAGDVMVEDLDRCHIITLGELFTYICLLSLTVQCGCDTGQEGGNAVMW